MKALVVYESMFGNTEEVARAVARGLAETMDVDILEVSMVPPRVSRPVDLVVVGGPTHAFSLSRPGTRADAIEKGATHGERELGLREWLTGLGDRPHAERLAAFDTRVERVRRLPGPAARKAARLARRHGFEMAGVESFYVSDTRGPLLPRELDRATAWGRRLASDMDSRADDPSVGRAEQP
jgi:hypothetical protein